MRITETMLYTFSWAGKPDRVSRRDIGDLKMIIVRNFEKSSTMSWLNSSIVCYKILETTVRDVNKLYVLGTKWPKL